MKVVVSPELRLALEPFVQELVRSEIASRISDKDSTIWGPAAQPEAAIRLGWTDSARTSVELIPSILALRNEFQSQGLTRVVLCGMGGSSLAPEVIAKTSDLSLVVLDSTDPSQVSAALIELEKTVVVVSSKSGSTVETDSQKRAFESAFRAAGIDPVARIVIVTDPGSPLDQSSRAAGYRVFNADPNVGGRYSALTAFGFVPSALAGADITALLTSASQASSTLASDSLDNPALWLGAALAKSEVAGVRRDKFLIETDNLPGFGDWVEQLVAESTGKEQKGVLPVVVTKSAPELSALPKDVLSISFSPALHSDVAFFGELGELFLLWEYATSVAGHMMGINPFDQPDVESAKVAARALLDSPIQGSSFDYVDRGIEVKSYGLNFEGETVEAAIETLLALANQSSYFAIHAYLNRQSYPQLESLRDLVAKRTGRPVTFGWGPRFLHSTGQYHKGGPKQGLFLQLTHDGGNDLSIEGRPFTFGTLIQAQAAGDAKVLSDNDLSVLSLKLGNPLADLQLLQKSISA